VFQGTLTLGHCLIKEIPNNAFNGGILNGTTQGGSFIGFYVVRLKSLDSYSSNGVGIDPERPLALGLMVSDHYTGKTG